MGLNYGKTNTTKEKVDKHILCQTRGEKGCEYCEKGIYTVAYTNYHLWKAKHLECCEKIITWSSALRKHTLKVQNAIKQINQESI